MWKIISLILSVIVVYLFIRLILLDDRKRKVGRATQKIFRGHETHALILLNDDINSIETVVDTLVHPVGMLEKDAIKLMLRTHSEGISVV